MKRKKIVIIGGGSFLWSPTILKDLVLTEGTQGSTVCLMDIDEKAVQLITTLGRKITYQAKADIKIEATTDRERALDGADYCILTISTGGRETTRYDLEIPKKYGIYQSVGDTTGPGGISRALRNVSVVVDIAQDMERICPNAWLINYSNPMSTICRAINLTTKIKTIGLCHEVLSALQFLRRIFKVKDMTELEVTVAGINHLVWILDLRIRGRDVYLFMREYIERYRYKGRSVKRDPFQDTRRIKFFLMKAFGYLPAAGDRHLAEFFPFFLSNPADAKNRFGVILTTADDRERWKKDSLRMVKDLIIGKKRLVFKKSQEVVSDIIAALIKNRNIKQVINIPNRGLIDNLQQDAIIEIHGNITQAGVRGTKIGNLPPGLAGILYPHVTSQELTVQAALKGDKHLALQALLLSPLVRDSKTAPKMLDEILKSNRKYLPRFR